MSNLSFVRHVGDGVTTTYALAVAGENIGYFRTSDIHVYVNGVEVGSSIDVASPHLVTLVVTPDTGDDILIRREMPEDKPYANFERGNNFGHRQVNNTFIQQLYLTQELLDGFKPDGYYEKQDLDLGGFSVTGISDATTDKDATSLGQVNKLIDSASNLDGYTAKLTDYIKLKIFQTPTGGGLTEIKTRTVNAGEVYEVRRASDSSAVTIYRDAAGESEIFQNGIANVSDSSGLVKFYIAYGDYYVEAGGDKSNFSPVEFRFSSVVDMLSNAKNLSIGGVYSTAGTMWRMVNRSNPLVLTDFEAMGGYNVKDFGALANGVTNDSVANQSIADLNKTYDESVVGTYVGGAYGDIDKDTLLHNRTNGRVTNPKVTEKLPAFGIETLQHWFEKFVGDNETVAGTVTQKVIVISGDSTTFGVGGTYATPESIFTESALNNGYINVGVLNRGRSGSTAQQWLDSYLAGDMATNPDLYVMRWGANDPFFRDTSTDELRKQGAVETLAIIRQAVAQARATRNVSQMSMVLCSPGPMNDVEKGRDEVYFERINAGLRQIALDYQCAFVDTYAMVQSAHGAANIWMDASDSDGDPATQARAVHPHDVMYEHQVAAVAEYVMPKHGIGWKCNNFRNSSLGRVVRDGADPASDYKAGIDLDRMDANSPYNGVSMNIRQADGGVLQLNYPMNGVGTSYTKGVLAARYRFNDLTSIWYGQAYDATSLLENGWGTLSGFGTLKLHPSLDGRLYITGNLSGGAVTDGTVLFTLYEGQRPKQKEIIPIQTDTQNAELRIGTDGNVELWNSGTPTYIVINSSFVIGN